MHCFLLNVSNIYNGIVALILMIAFLMGRIFVQRVNHSGLCFDHHGDFMC
jgi:hypothetical protein